MRGKWIPFLLILPAVLYLLLLMGYPLLETFRLAFTSDEGIFGNFKRLMESGEFWNSLKNTLLLTVVIVPLQLVLALGLALFVNKKFKGYTTILYFIAIPLALSDITAALMSYTIFSPNGYLNKILMNLGLIERPMYFFGYLFKTREFWVIALTEIWRATPLVFIIILAGLQSINKEYLEAAELFGFSKWKRFTKIILPLLKPSIMSALLLRTLFAFQIFGVVWLLAGRDIPVLAGETYYWYTFMNDPRMASAYALVIALVTIIVSWFYITFLRARHLEGAQ
ncbi:carbohydrate ABC transporter permease [Thermotoga sp.]|uniref:carbohydrate ABC transporter permease n=1 Tax=Thermotoga sp. TaxID=28240 RepID=UPI0025E7C2A5|nr:sugar ABC transporter permease [Thermotoga sp.]MCD6551470.1 sugar ABC transporter permease [Thermotoga sp.]